MFDRLRQLIKASDLYNSIVVVVSPLTALMQDQVKSFQSKGIKAALVGRDQTNEAIKSSVISGEYSLVYMSPESMVLNLKYREMFRLTVYQNNLVCLAIDEAHCVEKW